MSYQHYLSKSLFVRGWQCHKSLWLYKNMPDERDEPDDELEESFQQGTEFGIRARGLFPSGVEIPYDGLSYRDQLDMTRYELLQGSTTIYEAAFCANNIFIKVDMLHKRNDLWELYEVKSAHDLKDVHIIDAALQHHVLTSAGIDLSATFIVLRRSEEQSSMANSPYDVRNVSAQVLALQPAVQKEIEAQRLMLDHRQPARPMGTWCRIPYECDYSGYCSGQHNRSAA